MPVDIFLVLLSLSAVLLCAILIVLLLLLSKSKNAKQEDGSMKLLQDQLFHLHRTLDTRLSESSKIISETTLKNFQTTTRVSEESNKRIEEITKKLTELSETNKHIQDIGQELKGLENILKNPKQRGNLGEYFLKELLENVFTPEQYALQFKLSS
jgi:DNA recombination protein RmuC